MASEKLISFVMPAYKAKFLKQAIDSIMAQRYGNLELIIVDDASPENLSDIVGEYKDPRIRFYRNERNLGGQNLVKQWNHCIQYANGEYLVLAADDDLYDPQFLEVCVKLATKYPEVDVVRSRVEQIDEMNNLIGIDGILPEYCSKYQFLKYWLDAAAFTCIGNFMFKSAVVKQKQFIDFPSAFGSDTASAIMMAENGIANTQHMLFSFRLSTIHLSSSKEKLMDKLEANTMLFKWLRGLNYPVPVNRYDLLAFSQTRWEHLYGKCKYDYYNLVIKYMPFGKIDLINKCELLTSKDKFVMFLRFCFDKIFKSV